LLNGKQLFPEDYPATLKTVVALDGAMTSRLDLSAKQFDIDSGDATIEFLGLQGTLISDRTFSRSEVDISSPGARVAESGNEVLNVGQMSLKSNARRGVEGLMLGSGELQLEHIRANETGSGQLFDIEEIALSATSHAEGQQVAASMTTQLKSVKAAGREYGRSELTFSMGNLYAPVLLKIQEALNEIRSQNIDPQMQGVAVMSTLVTQAPLLLKHDPKLAIDRLYVETPEGPIDDALTVQAKGMTWDDLQGGFGFLQKLVADATLSLPETLFKQLSALQVERQITRQVEMRQRLDEEFTPPGPVELKRMIDRASEQQLTALLAQKLLVREGKQLASKAQFDKGKLTVNGNLLDLPFLPPPQ